MGATTMQQDNNRQGMLLFHLMGPQRFAIATLKVREIVPMQNLTQLPHSHGAVLGAATLRGETLAVVDLARAIGYPAPTAEERKQCHIIITEFSRRKTGFVVRNIDRIHEVDWREIAPPPRSLGRNAYITGVLRINEHLVEIIDIERVLEEIEPQKARGQLVVDEQLRETLARKGVMLVDDSRVARKQIASALDAHKVPYFMANDGEEALHFLEQMANEGSPIGIIVSDIEMPRMDGYHLTEAVRRDPKLRGAYIILHTSLSSQISLDRAQEIGANEALTKFEADELLTAIIRGASR